MSKKQIAPMGWNSWDCYGAAVTEKEVRQNADFMERQMLLSNPLVEDHTMVLSWFSYKRGIGSSDYGVGTAIGVFQSVVGITLLFIANKIAGLIGEDRLI